MTNEDGMEERCGNESIGVDYALAENGRVFSVVAIPEQ